MSNLRERFPNPNPIDEAIVDVPDFADDDGRPPSQAWRFINRQLTKWQTFKTYWMAEIGPSNSKKLRVLARAQAIFHKYKYRTCGAAGALLFVYLMYSSMTTYFHKRPMYKGIVDPMFNPPEAGLYLYDLDEVDAVVAWAGTAKTGALYVDDDELRAGYFSTPVYNAPDPRNVSLELLRSAMALNCVEKCACISALQLGIPRDIIMMTNPGGPPLFMVNPEIPYHSKDGADVEFSKSAGSPAPPRKKWAPRVVVFDYQLFPVPESGVTRSSRSFNAGKGSCGYYYSSLLTGDIKH